MRNLSFAFSIAITTLFMACNDDDTGEMEPQLEVPSTYSFERNGESSVDYSGQTARLDMVAEMKAYIGTANTGEVLSEQKLLDMFANENNPFSDDALNTSGKQLEDKTFLTDIDFYKDLFASAVAASESEAEASAGQAGLIARGPDRNILVDEKGHEYTQLLEKGMMGSIFLNQIYNVYLTESKTGDAVENESLAEGKNYTAMEHHWDEAFGYWGVDPDFDPEAENRFLGNYTYGRESYLGSATKLKDAFLKGRTAIVNKEHTIKNAQKDIIYAEFELIAAATAIHYINESVNDLNNGDAGGALFHHASEGYGFARALRFSPVKQISDEQIEQILNSNFGTDGNFWTLSIEGLQEAKATLIAAYPGLSDIADDL